MSRLHVAVTASVLVLAAAGCGDARPTTGIPNDCAACHGFPPATLAHSAAPGGTWEATDCNQCHPTSVDTSGALIPGGTHANGAVEGGHPLPFTDPKLHGPAANAGIGICQACHGTTLTGGTPGTTSCDGCHPGATVAAWRTDCTFCHGDAARAATPDELSKSAPPLDVRDSGETAGSSDPAEIGVGAHLKHAVDAAYACTTCHESVPTDIFSAGHIDGANGSIGFGELAVTGGRTPAWNRAAATCSSTWCHDRGGSAPAPTWTVAGTLTCASCHPAQPAAAAHPAHVDGETFSAGFNCGSCHQGTGTYANDHLNGVLDVAFDNAPVAGGTYAGGTCTSVYCHGSFTGGTAATVAWNGTVACGDCHANPPTTPSHNLHLGVSVNRTCGDCHTGYTPTTVDTGLHVNGVFDVPRLTTTACHPFSTGDNYGTSCDGRSDWQ